MVTFPFLNLSFGYIIAVIAFLGVYATRILGDLIIFAKAKKTILITILSIFGIFVFAYFAISQVMPLYLEMRLERFNNISEETRFNNFFNDLKIFTDNPF